MTAEEALALEVGSVVQTRIGQRWADVEVLRVQEITLGGGPAARLTLRRRGRTKAGRRPPSFRRFSRHVSKCPHFDPATANIYADYLDDEGEHRAAALLREAFPLGPG